MGSKSRPIAFGMLACVATMVGAEQPVQPVDVSPIDGEVYYLINQHSGLQWDVRSSGNGVFQLVNRVSGRPLSRQGRELGFHITPTL